MGQAQLRAQRPRPGGARFYFWRRVRLAAAAGQERPRVRRHRARPPDVLAVEGERRVPCGKKLWRPRSRRAARLETRRNFIGLDERR